MNKDELTAELKGLIPLMSEEQIEKTMNALVGCKAAINMKKNIKKGEVARLVPETGPNERELCFVGAGKKEGTIKALGASLLTARDFDRLKKDLPAAGDGWWLYDRQIVYYGERVWARCRTTSGRIRPVIIVEKIVGGIKPGDLFYVGDERFKLMTPEIAIRVNHLDRDSCTFGADNYESSVLRYCVDGWYEELARKSGKKQA